MTNVYEVDYPVGQDMRDVQATALAALAPQSPLGIMAREAEGVAIVTMRGPLSLPAEQALRTALANTTPDAAAFWRQRQTREDALRGAVQTLRQWAAEAQTTTVTSGNVVAVTQTIVNRFGVMSSRLADLVQNLYNQE